MSDQNQNTVVVGMSGGVDSSVSALLLKNQGFRVIGMFMKNWDEKGEDGVCSSAQDYEDVARVCDRLDIPYYGVEFIKEYKELVFSEFLRGYQSGLTPNPDILCNREIKFNLFFKKAMELGAHFLATGHYCRTVFQEGEAHLLKGADPNKDQTYFLYTLKSSLLKQVLFPLGHLEKKEVRRLAKENRLETHAKKDSTGICFIGERDFRVFLKNYLPIQRGEIKTLEGDTLGEHEGIAYYTLGQRKGLGLGGSGEPWFVVSKDTVRNFLYVARGNEHPALYSDFLIAQDLTWVSEKSDGPKVPFECRAKTRYRQKDQRCRISPDKNGTYRVEFEVPQRAVTPGQSVVFYEGDRCLGGGVIQSVGPSYFQQEKALPAAEISAH